MYREHALTYHQPQLQGACPCLPPTTVTGSMPLPTTNHSYREHALAYHQPQLQGACPCLPPTTVTGSMPLPTTNHSYREHALAYHQPQLQGACPCLPPTTVTGSMPLPTTNHSYREHALAYHQPQLHGGGSPKAFTSTTMLKTCGRKTSYGGQECYILKTHYEFPCPLSLYIYICIYIIQQFSLTYVVSESTLLNYANHCQNWTFQRFTRAAQKKVKKKY